MAGMAESVRRALGGTATPGAAELALATVTTAITEGLLEDGVVRLAGFGTFCLRERAPRRLLLPGTRTPLQLPRRVAVCFTPSPAATLPCEQAASPHSASSTPA